MIQTEPLIFESSPGKQTAAALFSACVGLILLIGFRHFDASGMTNSFAGFLLGILLVTVGAAGLLTQGRQTVVVDPQKRLITVEDRSRFGIRQRIIHFHEIRGTSISYFGKRSNFFDCYYIDLHLGDGTKYPLFPPGRFYDGSSERSVMEARRQQLEGLLLQDPAR